MKSVGISGKNRFYDINSFVMGWKGGGGGVLGGGGKNKIFGSKKLKESVQFGPLCHCGQI